MIFHSNTTISSRGKQAAMLGWKFDSTRQLWYRTTIFWSWDVSEQGMPISPPQRLMESFVPGRRCPRGALEQFPPSEPRLYKFVNGKFEDNCDGRPSSSNRIESSTLSLRSTFDEREPLPDNSSQSAISSASTYFSYAAQPETVDVQATKKESSMWGRLSLPRFKLTTPEGRETNCIVPDVELTRRSSESAGDTHMRSRSRPKRETGDVDNIWKFDEWKAKAA